jgi:hypothetical protein
MVIAAQQCITSQTERTSVELYIPGFNISIGKTRDNFCC